MCANVVRLPIHHGLEQDSGPQSALRVVVVRFRMLVVCLGGAAVPVFYFCCNMLDGFHASPRMLLASISSRAETECTRSARRGRLEECDDPRRKPHRQSDLVIVLRVPPLNMKRSHFGIVSRSKTTVPKGLGGPRKRSKKNTQKQNYSINFRPGISGWDIATDYAVFFVRASRSL
jgi:hypothetical protein